MILFTGGSGVLGKEIQKLSSNNILFPSSSEFNILDYEQCCSYIKQNNIIKIIHSAAFTNVKESQKDIIKSINTNVIGTINMVKLCTIFDLNLVFISTDHVFDGKKGDYKYDDPINPLTKYAKSKGAAELVARMYDKTLVIRTSFFGHDFPYEKAFVDQWSSKDYVDIMAPKILNACLSNETNKIVHVFSKKETIFEKAIKRKSNVLPLRIEEILDLPIPKDTSLV